MSALLWLAALASQDRLPVTVSYEDGLWFKSEDASVQVGITGRVAAQYRAIMDRPSDVPPTAGASRTQPNSLFLRNARIDLQGLFRHQIEFKLQLDAPSGVQSNTGTPPSAVTATVQDAYLAWRPSADFMLRFGQFKEPFGQEQTTGFRAIDFVERAVLDRLTPGRDLGIAITARGLDGLLEVELGAFNGNSRSVADANDEKDVTGRLRVSPFKGVEGLIQGLRLGVAGMFGDIDGDSPTPADPLDLTSTELYIKFLDAGGAGNAVDGRRTRVGLEWSWIWDAYGIRAEWVRREDRVITPAGRDRIAATAWVVSATAILTGEVKVLESRIVPAHPLDLDGGWGAVEVAVRVAQLRVEDDIFSLGIAAPGNANAVRTATAGVNWYATRFLRISPDVVVERYNRDIVFGGGRTDRGFTGFLLRVQVDF